MKTLTQLTAVCIETGFTEPPVHHHNNGEEHPLKTSDGRRGPIYYRFIRSGPAGIILGNSKVSIVIPKEELWKLAEKLEPQLAVPTIVCVPADADEASPKKNA